MLRSLGKTMNPPLISTVTLLTELLVTVSVLYIFISGYKYNKFHQKLLFATLLYEILININYMAHRVSDVKSNKLLPAWYKAFGAFHGIFSLIMFITLVIFFSLAWFNFRKDVNYFRKHKLFSGLFVAGWMISIISGIIFYFVSYF